MTNATPPSPGRPGRAVLRGLLDLRPSRGVERAAVAADEAVAQGLATAKVYTFASADYPGAAQSDVFDTDGTTIAPGITARHAPGHTLGHQILVVSSGDERVLLLGDSVTCPVQLEEEDWACAFDVDPALARATRDRLVAELEGSPTLVTGGHFSDFTFGRVMRGEGKRLWTVSSS